MIHPIVAHHAQPKQVSEARNRGDAPVKQERGERADADGDQRGRHGNPGQLQSSDQRQIEAAGAGRPDALQSGPEKSRILREADGARGDRERSAERKLPDEEERDEASQFLRAVDFFQIPIRSARARHGRAQFGPHQAIADG